MDLLLQRADIALYGAKVERGSAMLYDAASDLHTPERLALAAELKEGLDRGELFVEYQPKVHARTGAVIGFEALVRWDHPRHGRLMPDEFLPVVENTGLIGPLTLNVLEMALAAAASWRTAGHPVPVAVNLSVRHLTDLSLPQRIRGLLAAYDLPPQALVLEVTETLIMTDPVRALGVLHLLRDLGVAIAIDDFGTGYSSLAYLRRLEVDELKIDKSFVLDLGRGEGNATIVRSTIELGHNLGLRMVAEGVEDAETLALLRSWGCDVVQGYLFSRPLPASDVVSWLARQLQPVTIPAARAV
jgi:EAL domain-containing protein (putative c-di-GMP-specific phosphodiesterase class I)